MIGRTKHQSQPAPPAQIWAQAAHDLRQPVQAALLLTKVLDHPSSRAEQKRTIRQIEAALRSLHEMLDVLHTLARIELGLQIVQLRPCSLADILGPVVKQMAGIAADRGVALTCRKTRGAVRSNPKLLAMALRGLFLNAIEFGGGSDIVACVSRHGAKLKFEVHFRGASLDAARERNAFVLLSSGPIAGEPGLGLGLLEHLCRSLGHDFQHTRQPADGHLLALTLGAPR